MTITDHWRDLVTVALLGTDRRDPPAPPAGPLADVVDDALASTPAARMLTDVAATVAARRAGLRPAAPVAPPAPAPADERPLLPAAAADRARRGLRRWPVLEDEWLLLVGQHGWRLPPDLLVALLARHRRDAPRRGIILHLTGPRGAWLVDHQPGLGPPPRASEPAPIPPSRLDELPGLAVAPELAGLLAAPAARIVPALTAGLADGTFTTAHRQVLVNFLARCRADVLGEVGAALHTDAATGRAAALAATLADLVAVRAALRHDLEPT